MIQSAFPAFPGFGFPIAESVVSAYIVYAFLFSRFLFLELIESQARWNGEQACVRKSLDLP